jgi:peptidyl-prolyl cis-trans isomerase C
MMTKDMSVEKLIRTEIAPKVIVTEDEKKKFYSENTEQMKQPEQAKLSHILVKVESGSSQEVRQKAQEKASGLHQRIVAGEDFAALAREHSDDPGSKTNGGDLSWVSRGQTVPAFEKAAFALDPGEMSSVVETQFGYHIIKLAERKPSETMPYEQVEGRINEFLQQRHLQEAIQAEVDSLKSKSKIEILL